MASKRNRNRNETVGFAGCAQGRFGWPVIERLLACAALRVLYLWGPPGIGKTFSAYRKGRVDNGVFKVTLTPETPAAELRGHWLPKGSGFEWHDGPFVAAMRAGARLVVNELSHASDDVQALLYPLLESAETARLTLPTNETVEPAPGFHVICTDNEPPSTLPPALADRLDAVVEIGEPHPEALERLSPPLRHAARQSFALEAERRVSLRSWLMLEALHGELGLDIACAAIFGFERGVQIHDAIVLARRQTEMEW